VADSPGGIDALGGRRADPSWRMRATWLSRVVWLVAAFVAVYLLAVCTGIGQSAEDSLIAGRADQATIFGWRQAVPPLTRGTMVLDAGVALIVALTLIRRCWREGVAAIGIVVVTVAATETLHAVLARPRPAGTYRCQLSQRYGRDSGRTGSRVRSCVIPSGSPLRCRRRSTVLGHPEPYSPLGLRHDEAEPDPSVPNDPDARPSLDEVLELRADRMRTVHDLIAMLTDGALRGQTDPVPPPGYPPAGSHPGAPRPAHEPQRGVAAPPVRRTRPRHARTARATHPVSTTSGRRTARLTKSPRSFGSGRPRSPQLNTLSERTRGTPHTLPITASSATADSGGTVRKLV
jgi:hypothetical protein